MAKKKVEEFKSVDFAISDADIKKYREGINGLGVKYISGGMLPPFEQFCIRQGVAKVDEKGFFTVTNPYDFSKWVKVRDSVENFDSFKSDEMRRLFPEEEKKHKERFTKLREFVASMGIAKKV